ncbi:hypothetical protein H2199_006591 [Coniosporium tulheliwenetii]|uniref:Uncharacterized protein n=1 Tax=Coniosporium tulheliwenetii TaxID=3383036 RepID=A0ACC2YW29_9PEZI|nr:hypothetical protein H2199_006591 [Cladosporium sp. JES 115]
MAIISAPKNSGYVQTSDPSRPRSDAVIPFRELIPPPGHPRIKGIEHCNALEWCESRRQIEAPAWLINRLAAANLEKPYKGFTSNGHVEEGVYHYAEDEGAPVEAMTEAAEALLGLLSAKQRKETQFESVEADEIRLWSNPELYVNPGGLRLDECTAEVQSAVHDILKASFSEKGYEKVLGCCLTNDFLGYLVNGRSVMNEHSYNFRLFGQPDLQRPWGYTFFGHHLCLAVVVQGKRLVIGPTFMGAEPDRIDEGPHAGLRLFEVEELLPLKLMQSLSPELQAKATLSKKMDGDSLPADRWNPFDERHLAGARQDNRVVPYEGCPVKLFTKEQQDQIITLYEAFNEYYPEQVLRHRVQNFKEHLDRTYFAWIGEHGDEDPFYYRIHSPVAFMELDFHCGSEFPK